LNLYLKHFTFFMAGAYLGTVLAKLSEACGSQNSIANWLTLHIIATLVTYTLYGMGQRTLHLTTPFSVFS